MTLQSAVDSTSAGGAHHRESSFDRNWKLTSTILNRPSTSAGPTPAHKANTSSGTTDSVFTGDSGFVGSNSNTPVLTERNYFSGNESSSKGRRVLQKQCNSKFGGQKKSSYTEEQRVRAGTALSRHSRIGSSDTVRGESPTSLTVQGKDKNRPKSNSFSDSGSYTFEAPKFSSSPQMPAPTRRGTTDPAPPAVSVNTFIGRSASEKIGSGPIVVSPTSIHTPPNSAPPKVEKDLNRSVSESHSSKAASSVAELHKKSKKHNTSAWKEGLRNITPYEAAKDADFSGWMQKRGSGNLASWKPRFFVLNGRRLSYFYTENDTKERGLIDVTSHKVLAATGDRFVNIHASLAAATTPSTSPASTATSPHFFRSMDSPSSVNGDSSPKRSPLGPHPLSPTDSEYSKEREKEHKEHKERGWFTFKLVPPAPGAPRGVTFTPPRLHYFATHTKETGRAWMAAIMKATIEIDSTQPVTSSYSANTISLAKARALRARPPEIVFKSPGSSTGGSSAAGDSTKGLAITGIDIDHEGDNDNGDADVEENGDAPSRSASRAESNITTETNGTGWEKKDYSNDSLETLGVPTPPNKAVFLGMSGAGDVRSLGSGSLRSPSLEKLLSSEEVIALNSDSAGARINHH